VRYNPSNSPAQFIVAAETRFLGNIAHVWHPGGVRTKLVWYESERTTKPNHTN
jgi:hypothetical protein